MNTMWHRLVARFCCAVYFRRIQLVHRERVPSDRPICYVGLHRNGAVDAFVYNMLFPNIVFMISTQLRSNWFVRLFFHGIEVARDKDTGSLDDKRAVNRTAMKRCSELLHDGGELFIFPEGTSTLGPRHLPFKHGAARLIARFVEDGGEVAVVPLAIKYTNAWTFRSSVEVVAGPPILTELSTMSRSREPIDLMHARITDALTCVGTNFSSAPQQTLAAQLAAALTVGTKHSYYSVMKNLEHGIPGDLKAKLLTHCAAAKEKKLMMYDGVPLFSNRSLILDALTLTVLGPVVLAAAIFNAIPMLAGQQAARRCSDAQNVITFWRILVGIPALVAWGLVLAAVAISTNKLMWFAFYVTITWIGLLSYDLAKRLLITVFNDVVQWRLTSAWRALRRDAQHMLQRRGALDEVSATA